jgi:hypothetical protein
VGEGNGKERRILREEDRSMKKFKKFEL